MTTILRRDDGAAGPTPERPKFWSEDECRDVLRRLERVTTGGGRTTVAVWSTWTGYVRWARNLVSTAGEARDNVVVIKREINGAESGIVLATDVSDAGLAAAARHAERAASLQMERAPTDVLLREPFPRETATTPAIFSDATYQLDAERRAAAARRLAQMATERQLLSAGYVQVSAHALALLDTLGHSRYVPFTQAQCSVTVRDPKGTASGWAGVDQYDWANIDADQLTQVALEKCVKSQNPVRVEPGRYTVVLEPQAVSDFIGQLVYLQGPPTSDTMLGRETNESVSTPGPFARAPGFSRLGEKVIDERLTISTDPADPALGYPPFNLFHALDYWAPDAEVYHPATWIKNGVLQALGYSHYYAVRWLARGAGVPNPGGFLMSVAGPTASVDEMIANTRRGLLVTRFDQVQVLDLRSTLCRGYTRDGLWLIEDGKIAKPVKNFQFTEAIVAKLNSIEQLGAPTRAFHPMQPGLGGFPQPVVVPAMKLTDFSFTALADAV